MFIAINSGARAMIDEAAGFEMRYEAGTADEARLEKSIGEAWKAALNDPQKKAEIANLLKLKESELDPERPPFRAEITGSGLTGGEVIIAVVVAFAMGFGTQFATDMGGAAGKEAARRLRQLWTDYMRDEVSPPGSGKLGPPKDEGEEA
jgi:hypothetical protein